MRGLGPLREAPRLQGQVLLYPPAGTANIAARAACRLPHAPVPHRRVPCCDCCVPEWAAPQARRGEGSVADRFDKFTERARKVLQYAQDEAQRFNHNYIGTEHLLLGLVREGEGVAAKVLENMFS